MKPEVILVHGLWFGPWAMSRLAKQLNSSGFRVRRFAYASTTGGLSEHAQELFRFCQQSSAGQTHLVAHSLGGLVTLQMLATHPDLRPGRVVLLASPINGSAVARRVKRIPGASKLLGFIQSALESGYPLLPASRQTGMIAGSKSIGLGMLTGGAGKPSDGTVAVRETRVAGLSDHLVMPVTHTGIIYSGKVASQVAHFLHTGAFERPGAC